MFKLYIFILIWFLVVILSSSFSYAIELDTNSEFETVYVKDEQSCASLCKEKELCRGYQLYTTFVNDVEQAEKTCQLSNGLEENSPFSVPTPPPLNFEASLLDLNRYRHENNLPALTLNVALIRASQIHAADLANMGRISHTGSDGSEPAERVKRQKYNYRAIAENVASGQSDWPAAFEAWKNSPGHNENLLRDGVTDFGVALVFDPKSKYATYWVMLVGTSHEP